MTATTPPPAAHTPAYDVATLATCDAEPIHVPGAIQPHGVLIALDPELRAVMCSANLGDRVGVPAQQALGVPLDDLVGCEVAASVRERVKSGLPETSLELVLPTELAGDLAGALVDVRLHHSGDRLVVELEPIDVGGEGVGSYRLVHEAVARLAGQPTLASLTDQLAHEVQRLSGFDRVMVYRFDEEWNGEVVAEVRRPDLNPFLGLHYPATDIPAQARRLYELNPIRLIVDIEYRPVPLEPVFDAETGEALDLSFAALRSVSPIHVEYLSHMGVTASMSVSLLIDDTLWGLVACHHYSGPHRPMPEARAAAELVSQTASHLISHRERAEARELAVASRSMLAEMTARMSANVVSPIEALVNDPLALDLVGASGLALNFDGTVYVRGAVPPRYLLERIAELTHDPEHYAVQHPEISALDADLAEFAPVAAGVLRLGSTPGRWLMWFRPEHREIVDWGGDPSNKRLAAEEPAHVRLSPRRSFERWREVTRGRAVPFTAWELEVADSLGRHTNSLLSLRSREQIAMAESMQRSVVLDRAPEFADATVVARYRPASDYQLGGDWWDAFELPGGRIALVVGDVAGHGVAAASAMTQLRTALRAYLFEGHDAAECLDRLDRLAEGLLGLGVATALVGLLEPSTGRLELASAGHPVPLMVRAGRAEPIDVERRPLLGVGMGHAPRTSVVLPPDALFVAYTDGLVERRGVDIGERTEQLLALASGWRSGESAELWADRVLAAFDSPEDDTTLIAVRRG
ncbi:SpoIIE family protein phosphatase [Nocardioides sp. R-C-SC26]|uniref:SpoIIE family protein phosphatase n=1 Tax=Nocardioides sp. R-C-SC26 TaxID=2870414 RepID=UPI001E46329B|nr:SpoIIE family protein phosphatase [Nocardioides sp. R-C-SC26]